MSAPCSRCGGQGWTTEHHQDCFGGGETCEKLCPVQEQCSWCRSTGIEPGSEAEDG